MDTIFIVVLALMFLYAVLACFTVARDLLTGGYKRLNGVSTDLGRAKTEVEN